MIHNAYLESKILTADPIELVQMMYQQAIDSIRDARRRLAEGDIAKRSAAISKSMEILTELTCSLNYEAGGEISRNLARLYEYMQRRLLEANVRQTDEPLAETLSLLSTLTEAWRNMDRPAAHEPQQQMKPHYERPESFQPSTGYNRFMAEPAGAAEAHAWTF